MYQEATQRVGRASVLESPLRSARASAAAAAAASRAAEEQRTARAADAAADPGEAVVTFSLFQIYCSTTCSLRQFVGQFCRCSHLDTPKPIAHATLRQGSPVALPRVIGLGLGFIVSQ